MTLVRIKSRVSAKSIRKQFLLWWAPELPEAPLLSRAYRVTVINFASIYTKYIIVSYKQGFFISAFSAKLSLAMAKYVFTYVTLHSQLLPLAQNTPYTFGGGVARGTPLVIPP